jgi:phosphoribosylaminoimidazole-succinocarboxamide synthase
LRENQILPQAVITPTTKALDGGHDEPLSADDIVRLGLMTRAQWDAVSAYGLALFEHGRSIARKRGLILADTKYEFGVDADGRVALADEIHTPDSSRYWRLASYDRRFESGTPPESFDKDVIRNWIVARCNPYQDPIPEISPELRLQTAAVYIGAFETITGEAFAWPDLGLPPASRIRSALRSYIESTQPQATRP